MYPLLVTRYYYSLADLSEKEGPGTITNISTFDYLLRAIDPIFTGGAINTAEQTMFQKYLWPEFYESPIFYYDVETQPFHEVEEPELEDVVEAFKPVLGRMYRWYEESKERYLYLITQLEGIKSSLLGPVKTVTVGESTSAQATKTIGNNGLQHLESDTPQDGGQDVFATGYVSRASKDSTDNFSKFNADSSTNDQSTVSNDADTPIARFEEVQNKLHNLYSDWADEFARFIIRSAE